MKTEPPSDGPPSVSVVVPVRDDAVRLERCLDALAESTWAPAEIVVVDDASRDGSGELARRLGARVVRLATSRGPAYARNRGAEAARGDVLFFVDADVYVRPDTLERAVRVLADPSFAAVIGSYDDTPADPHFLSQYKNLFHHWVHQTSREEAWTFWSGCGAIRRGVFLAMGGFDESYRRPSIEDIELGFRLRAAGYRIRLEKRMQATHAKRWRFFDLVRTDVWRRGVPWIALMLRHRTGASDLNLSRASQFSTLLTYGALAALAAPWVVPLPAGAAFGAAAAQVVAVVVLHRGFYRFFLEKRGALFAVRVLPLHLLFFLYSGLCVPLGVLAHALGRRRGAVAAAPLRSEDSPPLEPARLEGGER